VTPFAGWELAEHEVVLTSLEQAWVDSFPLNAQLRHEEGGWVYQDLTTGVVRVVRAPSGEEESIDLTTPPEFDGQILVATFHTHPHPESEGWYTGPSFDDTDSAWALGVPCIIKAEDRIYVTGPSARRE
jgi:hypothetical protein